MIPQAWRRRVLVGVAVVLGVIAVALAADIFSELGVTQERAKDGIFEAFTNGYVPIIGNAKVFKAAAPDKRVLFVQGVTALAKTYASSADFKKRYAEYREANKPEAPEEVPAQQRKIMEEAIAQTRAVMKQLPPDQQKEMRNTIEEMQAQLEGKSGQQKEWEQRYPQDANLLIATRLREFLNDTKDIDFAAKLVPKDGKLRFADANLEAKSNQWKMYFRAGREATEAARAFAAEWLKELGGSRE